MIPFKAIAHNQEYSFNCPTSWEEITLKQWLRFRNDWDGKDICQLLAILTNLDRDVIYNSADIDMDEKIFPHLKFINKKFQPEKLPVPEKITIAGKEYDVPKDITLKCLGQKLTLHNYMAMSAALNKKQHDCYAYAIAIYFYPEITGNKFDDEEAKKLISDIENCKVTEAYPVGAFFFNSFMQSLTESAKTWRSNIPVTKFSQAWTNLMLTVGSVRWTLLPKAIFLNMKKFYSCRMHTFSKN